MLYCIAGAAFLIAFAVYLPDLRNEFVQWDDDAYIFENPFIRSFDPFFFRSAFLGFYSSNWHPLTWISHAADFAIWGLNPSGHHLTNNILHGLNTFLLVLIVAKLLESGKRPGQAEIHNAPDPPHAGKEKGIPRQKDLTKGKHAPALGIGPVTESRFTLIAAGAAGLLFGIHPIHVESVAWAAERKDLLCAFFFLLTILSYTSYKSSKAYGSYFLSLSFFVLALLSKPMAVSLPFVLLILDWFPFQRARSFKDFGKLAAEKIPFIALSIISSVVTIFAQRSGDSILSAAEVSFPARTIVAINSLSAYLLKIFLPLKMVPYYPYPTNVSFFSARYFFPILIAAAITVLALLAARKQKLWLAAWSYYVITLLPVLGIVQVGGQGMADRYAYLPGAAPLVLAGLGLAWGADKMRKAPSGGITAKAAFGLCLLVLVSFLSYKTVRQIGVWQNSMTLWNYVIGNEPRTYFAYNNRGAALYAAGRIDEAILDYESASALYPAYFRSHYNLGLALFEKGELDRSISEYQTAIRLAPREPNIHLNLGVAYSTKGLSEMARQEYAYAESLAAGSPDLFFQLGSFLSNRGFVPQAIEQFRLAIRIRPDYADAHTNLAAALYRAGRMSEALDEYLVVSRLRPGDATAYLNLGSAYGALGLLDQSIVQFRTALKLKPDYADAHYNLGVALRAKGMMDGALEHLEAAARLNPGDPAIRTDLARAYEMKKTSAN